MYINRPVIVMQLPEDLHEAQAKVFLAELQPLLEIDRPRIVLDCSEVQHIDGGAVEILLRCLEEALKRNGDLKLAAVSPSSALVLELMHVDSLFQVFANAQEASGSFDTFGLLPASQSWYPASEGVNDMEAAS